ncbi:hypothetical protein L6452_33834 [Arctium lappa]|uniref:Uncharacterized protein n=1 Tax=Arctium lappa TaxID=4217 RepID=A0ACB8YKR5_ARCLA|nr:hypothetical protein L6452_33834 [Arctium lappa]
MMVFGHSATGGGFLPGKQQVFLVDYEADVSQCLLQASYSGDLKSAFDCIDDPYVEVNLLLILKTYNFKTLNTPFDMQIEKADAEIVPS